jgi:hypothetical protein
MNLDDAGIYDEMNDYIPKKREMFENVSQIRKANEALGQTWFGAGEMNFFNTVIEAEGQVFLGHYFVTSDRMELSDPKRYTLRVADSKGRVSTVGNLRDHASVAEAVKAIPNL